MFVFSSLLASCQKENIPFNSIEEERRFFERLIDIDEHSRKSILKGIGLSDVSFNPHNGSLVLEINPREVKGPPLSLTYKRTTTNYVFNVFTSRNTIKTGTTVFIVVEKKGIGEFFFRRFESNVIVKMFHLRSRNGERHELNFTVSASNREFVRTIRFDGKSFKADEKSPGFSVDFGK